MTSSVRLAEKEVEKDWNVYTHSWYSTVDFLLYIFIAILFFSLGRNWANVQRKMQERAQKNSFGSYSYNRQHRKLKTDEPDEEKLSIADENDSNALRGLKQELDESRVEIRQLSDELRRLRQKESTMDAENQILKSKLMQQDPIGKTEAAQKYSTNIPKLSAPDESNNHNLTANATEDQQTATGGESYNPFDNYTGGSGNAGYNENYNQGYYDYNSGTNHQANE